MKLLAPLKGWVTPLDEAPDEVFAGRMLGDGVAIDPTGDTLHAPCDGEVATLAPTLHAITLRTAEGVELLMHIGLETVALKGEGFTAHVTVGQKVKVGDPLISFDLDRLAQGAKSLLTPIVVTSGEAIEWRDLDREIEVGAPLMSVAASAQAAERADSGEMHSRRVTLGLPHGLHARPAGRLAALAKPFAARVEITLGDKAADVASPVALMTLGATVGAELVLIGQGADALAALDALAGFLASDGGERAHAAPAAAPTSRSARPGMLVGVTAAPGLAVGPAARLQRADIAVQRDGAGVAAERAALADALLRIKRELNAPGAGGDILAAHLALLDDPQLLTAAEGHTAAGRSAAYAWGAALDSQAGALTALSDPRLRERADDLIDLKRRVQLALGGVAAEVAAPPKGAVLLAEDLLPSELVALSGRIAGLCTARGGPTSHVAIIAASLGLPAVVAAGEGVLAVAAGATVVLNAEAGELRTAPAEAEIVAARAEQARRAAERASALAAAAAPCRTADGVRLEVFANLGRVEEAAPAVAAGAEGCGLLRTEFLFMDRPTPPDEAEQRAAYQAIADGLEGRPLIVRTLDIGGDKPVAYLPALAEDNPALGLRGVRLTLERPDLLDTQLRAILGVRPLGQCRIMLPMIADLEEFRRVRQALDQLRAENGIETKMELGVMIETPAAALIAAELAREADFLSIGTNDLTQYTLAMDRTNPAVAGGIDALHPAVLRLIGMSCEGAAAAGKPVGVCGGLASEPSAAALLIGLGVSELSAAPAAIPALKAAIRPLTLEGCRSLARQALAQPDAAAVRALLEAAR